MRENDLVRCVFDGRVLEPDGNYAAALLHDRLGAGEVVLVDVDPERSGKSHRHAFAFVRTAWQNLPERLKDAPYARNETTLRRHALIACGYCTVNMIALGTEMRAERLAAFLRRADQAHDSYSVIESSGPVVHQYIAESQSMKAMGGPRFQASKQAILEWLADLIGVTPDALAKMGKREAA